MLRRNWYNLISSDIYRYNHIEGMQERKYYTDEKVFEGKIDFVSSLTDKEIIFYLTHRSFILNYCNYGDNEAVKYAVRIVMWLEKQDKNGVPIDEIMKYFWENMKQIGEEEHYENHVAFGELRGLTYIREYNEARKKRFNIEGRIEKKYFTQSYVTRGNKLSPEQQMKEDYNKFLQWQELQKQLKAKNSIKAKAWSMIGGDYIDEFTAGVKTGVWLVKETLKFVFYASMMKFLLKHSTDIHPQKQMFVAIGIGGFFNWSYNYWVLPFLGVKSTVELFKDDEIKIDNVQLPSVPNNNFDIQQGQQNLVPIQIDQNQNILNQQQIVNY